jgi:hypothetical protein
MSGFPGTEMQETIKPCFNFRLETDLSADQPSAIDGPPRPFRFPAILIGNANLSQIEYPFNKHTLYMFSQTVDCFIQENMRDLQVPLFLEAHCTSTAFHLRCIMGESTSSWLVAPESLSEQCCLSSVSVGAPIFFAFAWNPGKSGDWSLLHDWMITLRDRDQRFDRNENVATRTRSIARDNAQFESELHSRGRGVSKDHSGGCRSDSVPITHRDAQKPKFDSTPFVDAVTGGGFSIHMSQHVLLLAKSTDDRIILKSDSPQLRSVKIINPVSLMTSSSIRINCEFDSMVADMSHRHNGK